MRRPVAHHRREGAFAEKGDRTRGIATHLGFDARPRLPEFVRRHIDGPSRRPVDDGGQAASELEQAPLLVRLKADVGEAGEMQHRPEAIAAAGEVVTGDCGGRSRVHAAEDHVEIAGENVRFIRAQIRSLHYALRAVARWRLGCVQAVYRKIEVDAPARQPYVERCGPTDR
jgi:hypothetical protein